MRYLIYLVSIVCYSRDTHQIVIFATWLYKRSRDPKAEVNPNAKHLNLSANLKSARFRLPHPLLS